MTGVLKESTLAAFGGALGLLLLFVSSSHVDFRGFGDVSWGYPMAWRYQGDLMTGGVSIFGVYLGSVSWVAFCEDLLFWVGASLAAVEGLYHVALHYFARRMRTPQKATPLSCYPNLTRQG